MDAMTNTATRTATSGSPHTVQGQRAPNPGAHPPGASGDFPVISTHTASPDQLAAQFAYDDAKAAYDRAVTLQQTQKAHALWPALCEAKHALLALEVGRG